MAFIEYLIYEGKPFAYAALASFSLASADGSKIAALAGLMLAFCSLVVLHRRFEYRTYSHRTNKIPRL